MMASLRREEITLPAAGLAFYALVSLVPFVILVLWLTGLVVGTDRVREVGENMARLAPAKLGIDKAFTRVADLGAGLGLGAVVGLLWPASSYGAGLVRAFDRLSPRHERRMRGLRGRWLSVALVGLVPALALAALVAVYLGSRLLGTSGTAARIGGWLLAPLFGFGAAALMLGTIYRLFTPERLPWRAVARGALTAAVSIALLSLAYVVYLRVGADFASRYASSSLAAVILLAFWLYLANALVLVGYTAALEA
jgi:membrane protein